MERKDYINACQKYAISGDKLVTYQNAKYAPIAYQLSFFSDGKVRHTAVLKDITANSLVYAKLSDVN